jgi:NADH-dependent peroxiredoxin subunit C
MACVNGVKPLKKKSKKENVVSNLNLEEKQMSTTMVRQQIPEFEMDAYDAKSGHYTTYNR